MHSEQRGFTLIEVLLAILIGSLVLTSIYGIFTSVSEARNRLAMESEVYHQVRIFFDRLGGELRSLRGSAASKQPVLETGTTLDGEPYLEFSTELVSPLLQQRGGLSRVRYEVRQGETGKLAIFRSEKTLLADLSASQPLPFIEGLESFEVRYLSNGNWRNSWSNRQPPQAVEISLEAERDGRLLPFRTSFMLPPG